MSSLLLDTHAWAWALIDPDRLTRTARAAIEKADRILVSPISIFEIAQKVRLGKWRQMDQLVQQLPDLISQAGSHAVPLTPEIGLAAGLLDWVHRDPFDRILAATAIQYSAALMSTDAAFDTLPKGTLKRIW